VDKVKIALAKGRTADVAIEMMAQAGIVFKDYSKSSRKLIFKDSTGEVEMILVKSGDVPIYVEKGAADIGVVGKDVLLEEEADIFEVLNLKIRTMPYVCMWQKGFRIIIQPKIDRRFEVSKNRQELF
jgi:ATP phosphoribosyltransferase